jgi:transposase
MKRKSSPPVFKEYTQGQVVFLPTDLGAQIPPTHLVRVVSTAIEKMDLSALVAQYKGGGTSSNHPKMLLKMLIYAYTQQLYSSRKIAKALRENIYFMWLSGNQQPDFRTLNRFRSEVVKEVIEDIFASVLELLIEDGMSSWRTTFWMARRWKLMPTNTAGCGARAPDGINRNCRRRSRS